MKTIILALACALGLAGCKTQAEQPADEKKRIQKQAEQIAAADDARCRSYGLQIGTAAYADCRLRLESLDFQELSLFVQTGLPLHVEGPSAPTFMRCQSYGGIADCRSY